MVTCYVILYIMSKLSDITIKKKKLDSLNPISDITLKALEDWFKIELTYSSNAIEGNTLNRRETAEVIERGISAVISGKPLKDLLEARNHAMALEFIENLTKKLKGHQFITVEDIKAVHKIILTGIDNNWAGTYRQTEVFIKGSNAEFPPPQKVPPLMKKFINWLQTQQGTHPVQVAADAHFKFVSIHPFIDGNGRTARLLMNIILIMNGYPMAIIPNEEKSAYLATFDSARIDNNMEPFYDLIEKAVERSLDAYINAAKGKPTISALIGEAKFLKIGQMAKACDETIPTIRWWTKEGLLKVSKYTQSGYLLYEPSEINRVKEIKYLQENQRLTLAEIKEKLGIKPQKLGQS